MSSKKVTGLVIASLFTLAIASFSASANETSSAWDTVTYDPTISFTATLQADGSVLTSWSRYVHAEAFTYYKVVRSTGNTNPVYPDDGYIFYSGDPDELSYLDEKPEAGSYYYRVCQIAAPKRYCSQSVARIDVGGYSTSQPTTSEPVPVSEAPAFQPAAEINAIFTDLPADHWARACVERLSEDGIVEPAVSFRPNDPVNRAEFLKLVMSAYYPEISGSGSACFGDVRAGDWFAKFACAAKAQGIVSGYADGTFGPARRISRAEGAALLVKALRIPLDTGLSGYFPDVFQQWQLDYVQTAYVNGLVNGYANGQFGPDNSLARSEAAQLICNALESYPEPLDAPVDYDQYQPAEDEQPAQTEDPVTPPSSDATTPSTPATPAIPATVTGSISNSAPLIIDHRHTSLGNVPQSAIETAKSTFRIAYGHTSHGSQITSGMETLRSQNSLYDFSSSGGNGALYYNDNVVWGDLGGDWESQTRDLLGSNGNNINLVIWSWCGQMSDMSSDDVNAYLSAMNALEEDFPNVIFVYMTGHLDGSGESGTLHRNNQMVRDFANQYNKVLFDFADIESYDPSGSYFLNRSADDANNYDAGNWSTQWCSANSGSPLCQSVSCAHSESLNCNLKGRAFWYLLARLGGWNG